jgi:hypothetical protein
MQGPRHKVPVPPSFEAKFMRHVSQVMHVPARSSFVCVDSRQAHLESLRTWGGDFLELVRVLSYMADHMGLSFSQNDVDHVLYTWLDATLEDPVGLHYNTDLEALTRLGVWLGDRYGVAGSKVVDIIDPPVALQPYILEGLALPRHQGNMCMRLAVDNTDLSAVRPDLFAQLTTAFFKLLWRRDYPGTHVPIHAKLSVVVAEGTHAAEALVRVKDSSACREGGLHGAVAIGYHGKVEPARKPSLLEAGATVNAVLAAEAGRRVVEEERERQASLVQGAEAFVNRTSAAEADDGEEDADAADIGEWEQSIEAMVSDIDPEFKSFLSQFRLDAEALRELPDEHGAGAVRAIGEELLRLSLASRDDELVSQLQDALGVVPVLDAAMIDQGAVVDADAERRRRRRCRKGKRGAKCRQRRAKEKEAIKKRRALHKKNAASADADVENKKKRLRDSLAKYYVQKKLQVLMFNEDAVMNLRKEMLDHMLGLYKLGTLREVWPAYEKESKERDQMYIKAFASRLPNYILWVE